MSDPFNYKPEDALYGPLGAYARQIAGHIEVDPYTFYVQLLAAIGVLVGRRARCMGGHTPHHCNLFALIIGPTGIGKGSAWSLAERFAERVDPAFPRLRSFDVQSAPGLIQLVTDGQRRPAKRQKPGAEVEYEVVIPAVADKRRLIINEEMQTVLTAKDRRGATLGQLMKLAWDGKDLENNAKEQLRATAPHIGFIGHITPEDLRTAIARDCSDRTSGFYNRFIFSPAQRVRTLPFGGQPPACEELAAKVRAALQALGPIQPSEAVTLGWADDARAEWEAFYNASKSDHPFLAGLDGFHDRLAPHAMRVAMLFAVIDGTRQIHLHHLTSAKALCLHALNASRDFLVQNDVGNGRVTLLRDRLRTAMTAADGEFTKTDVWNRLGRHGKAEDVQTAIDSLVEEGIWKRVSATTSTPQISVRYQVTVSEEQATDDLSRNAADAMDTACVDGHLVGLGAAFVTPRPIDALDPEDRPAGLAAGCRVRLVQAYPHASEADRLWLSTLVNRKPHHRLTLVRDGCLRFLPAKQCLQWASGASSP